MSTELTNPLLDVIRRASQSKGTGLATGARKRMENCTENRILLCDVSSSMSDFVGSLVGSKIDHLKIAAADVLKHDPGLRIFIFASRCEEVKRPEDIMVGPCGGGTNLANALNEISALKPKKTIIISDGEPDNPVKAAAVAEKMTGSIDTIFCGHDGMPGAAWLSSLARDNFGTSYSWNGTMELGPAIRGLLA